MSYIEMSSQEISFRYQDFITNTTSEQLLKINVTANDSLKIY